MAYMMASEKAQEILRRPYRRVLVPDPESGFATATIPEFPGCIAEGESEAEALENLRLAATAWVESALSRDMEVPPPSEEREYSGRFPLRLPRTLHQRIARAAEEDGISLNAFIVMVLAERVGLRAANRQTEEFLRSEVEQLRSPRVVQLTGILQEAGTEPWYTFEGPDYVKVITHDVRSPLPGTLRLADGREG